MANIPYDFEVIKKYLSDYGYMEVDSIGNKELLKIYKEHNTKVIFQFQAFLNQDEGLSSIANLKDHDMQKQLKEKLHKIDRGILKIYDLIDEYIEHYSYENFLEILSEELNDVSLNRIKKILRIKYRQVQEIWLEKLEMRFMGLPVEERIPLIKFYEKHRNNIQKLKEVYESSQDPTYVQDLKNISEIKLNIIQTFMPELMEENYRDYYDENPEKLELIDSILKLRNSYSKRYLKDLTMPKLKILKAEIIEQDEKELQENKIFHKYVKILSSALLSMEENEFSNACLEIITKLNNEQVQKIVGFLATKHKFFISKFNEAIKDYQSIMKVKFI